MPLVRAAASSVAVILCACSPPADPAPMAFGVLNAACTAERIAAERAAGVTVVELPLAWDRYEPEPGQVDPAYVAEVHRKIDTCRAAGMRIVLGPGLQYPPDWVRALPDAVLRGSAGNLPAHGGLDLVFNAAVRDAASSYLGHLASDLSLASAVSGVTAMRIGVSGTGELAYPGPDAAGSAESAAGEPVVAEPGSAGEDPDVADPGLSAHEWWAFGAAPRPVRASPTGRRSSPLPGWVPGQREWRGAPVTPEQADAWLGWYTTSLIDTVAWQVGRLRELGFRGAVHVPVAGRGILPADRGRGHRRAARRPGRPGRCPGAGPGLSQPVPGARRAARGRRRLHRRGRRAGRDRAWARSGPLPARRHRRAARPHRHVRLAGPALDVRARPRHQRGAGGENPGPAGRAAHRR